MSINQLFNLNQLKAFVSLAETLSFTSTAALLHITQPTLSGTIRLLEEQIGARLFDRDTRKVRLTPIGEEFVVLARRVLAEASRASAEIKDLVGARKGTVRLGALSMLLGQFLLPAIESFRKNFPDVRLELLDVGSEQCHELLQRGQVDLAVYTLLESDPMIETTEIGTQSIVTLIRDDHPLAKLKEIEWKRLIKEPIIALRSSTQFGRYGQGILLQHGLGYEPSFRVEQLITAVGLVRSGMGVAVMSRYSAEMMSNDGLICRPIKRPFVSRPICVGHLVGREISPASSALEACIINTCAGY